MTTDNPYTQQIADCEAEIASLTPRLSEPGVSGRIAQLRKSIRWYQRRGSGGLPTGYEVVKLTGPGRPRKSATAGALDVPAFDLAGL